jgi:hypothetical protein
MNPEMNQGASAPQKESAGALISIIIVAILLIVGAYYAFRNVPLPENNLPTVSTDDQLVTALSKQGSSDEIQDIEFDLAATPDLSVIGSGLGDIQL